MQHIGDGRTPRNRTTVDADALRAAIKTHLLNSTNPPAGLNSRDPNVTEMARVIGVDRGTIHRLISGRAEPGARFIAGCRDAGIDINRLIRLGGAEAA